jgi:hypothetical protein
MDFLINKAMLNNDTMFWVKRATEDLIYDCRLQMEDEKKFLAQCAFFLHITSGKVIHSRVIDMYESNISEDVFRIPVSACDAEQEQEAHTYLRSEEARIGLGKLLDKYNEVNAIQL